MLIIIHVAKIARIIIIARKSPRFSIAGRWFKAFRLFCFPRLLLCCDIAEDGNKGIDVGNAVNGHTAKTVVLGNLAIGEMSDGILQHSAEEVALVVGTVGTPNKIEDGASALCYNTLYAETTCQSTGTRHLEQVFHRLWQGTEAVRQILFEI